MKNIYRLHYTFHPCPEDYFSVPLLIIYHAPTTSTPDLSPTQPPNRYDSRVICPRVKRPGRGTDHSHPSSADIQNDWRYTPTRPHTPSCRAVGQLCSNINSQLDATITNFIDNYNQLSMFQAIISPILRNTRLCLQLVV